MGVKAPNHSHCNWHYEDSELHRTQQWCVLAALQAQEPKWQTQQRQRLEQVVDQKPETSFAATVPLPRACPYASHTIRYN
jgi:hypothetical protein